MLQRMDDVIAIASEVHARDLHRVVEWLPSFSDLPEIQRVILFGSRARGDNEERSDIDLAIDAPDADIHLWDRICRYVDDEARTLLPIDLMLLHETTDRLRTSIEAEGVILFEREDTTVH